MGVTYTFGAQAAEIRIEKKTGKILVDQFVSTFDVGQVINPLQIRGSVLGGVTMAIGAALYEEVEFDEMGASPIRISSNITSRPIKKRPEQTLSSLKHLIRLVHLVHAVLANIRSSASPRPS